MAVAREAARGGLAVAQEHVAVERLLEGKSAEGAAWARRAAQQGDAPAAALLGELLATGHGTRLDQTNAYFWLLRATANPHADPATNRAMEQTPYWLEWARVWLTPDEARAVEEEAARWIPTPEPEAPCVRRHTPTSP